MTIQEIIERLEDMQDIVAECYPNFDEALGQYQDEVKKLLDELKESL